MPEYRYDAILDRRVVVAAERAARPYTTTEPNDHRTGPDGCPFCPDHEHQTPPETFRTGDGAPDTPGWRVRVVPNLYPIVGTPDAGDATGAHEVVILSPDHDRDFAALDDAQATEAFGVLRDRIGAHLSAGRAYAVAFVNHGRGAGASIEHPHAQIVAPDAPADAVVAMTERFTTDLVAAELAQARRHDLVVVDGPAPAWCPPASWSPYQLRVAHRSTRARFDEATDAEVAVVAVATRDALRAVRSALPGAAYNVIVHSAPPEVPTREMHWHVEIVPRTSVVAGFELGSGAFANSVAPEGRGTHPARSPVRIHLCITIGAPVEHVWATIADISTHTQWMTDAESIDFVTDQRADVGTEFDCRTRIGPFITVDRMRVTEWQTAEVIGIEHRGLVTGVGRFTLGAAGPGLTEFCWTEELHFPLTMGGALGERVGRPVLARIWRANLRRLRDLAEA